MKVRMMLPALTEATSPPFRPIKYSQQFRTVTNGRGRWGNHRGIPDME
ncbi:MAG: hypothetical protein ACXVZX_15390 [Terriglobales bacterium]